MENKLAVSLIKQARKAVHFKKKVSGFTVPSRDVAEKTANLFNSVVAHIACV
jgi:hypothetical protein